MSSIVLVHGAWSDASAWQQVADLLTAAGHHVSAPDLPAHGSDRTSPADASLDGYTETVIAVAERLAMLSHPAEVAAAITELTANHH